MLLGNITTSLPTLAVQRPIGFRMAEQLIGYLFGFLLDAGSPLVLLWAICSNKTLVLNPLFLKQKESSTLLKYKRLQAAVRHRHQTHLSISRL
ncbi:Uncharacterized protein HZ326_8734 [Fusarium oxysporum f. sp. albedinis]|nr:Uncharacterized protein HZ326_8734 [Fusarium oxysporum f. sp. albedinis]